MSEKKISWGQIAADTKSDKRHLNCPLCRGDLSVPWNDVRVTFSLDIAVGPFNRGEARLLYEGLRYLELPTGWRLLGVDLSQSLDRRPQVHFRVIGPVRIADGARLRAQMNKLAPVWRDSIERHRVQNATAV